MHKLTVSQTFFVSGGNYKPCKYIEMGISTGLVIGTSLSNISIIKWLTGNTPANHSLLGNIFYSFVAGEALGLGMGFYQEYQLEKISRTTMIETSFH